MVNYRSKQHTSKYEITGTKSMMLEGKKIAIGMTGSVAVLEMIKSIRLLMRHGAEVIVFMTGAATELVHPNLVEWATGNPVITKLTGQVEHVHLGGEHPERADVILIAPATANTIGKIANGIDDTPVTSLVTTAVGTRDIPLLIVPAMHATMYNSPMVIQNIKYLKKVGIKFVGPKMTEGKAKIATADEILERVISSLSGTELSGKKIVVTAGPTRVWLDDIRFISNPSSGKMGISLALEVAARGADTTLILGPTCEKIPNSDIKIKQIETPQDIIDVINTLEEIDVFISAAAISDYQPVKKTGKIPSKHDLLKIDLKPTPKILAYVRKKYPRAVLVGFKAESVAETSLEELKEKAIKRAEEHKLDMIVANFVDKANKGFGSGLNEVYIYSKQKKVIHLPLQSKRSLANKIITELLKE